MLQTWLPWLTLNPSENERIFRRSFYKSMRPATNRTALLSVGVIIAFTLYGVADGEYWLAPDNLFRMMAGVCLLVFLLINPLLNTRGWLISLFVTALAVMLTMCLAFWNVALQWGAIGEGGPMLVAMLYGIVPVLHLGHKLVCWLVLGVAIGWIVNMPGVDPGWTMFYYCVSIVILSIFQLQMDRLLRVRFHAERVEREKAETDQLTGALNRYAFEKRMTDLLERMGPGDGVVLSMIDIDFFKAYNDHYGHLQGDLALVAVAKGLHEMPADLVIRFGGEEFILVARYRGKRPAWLDRIPDSIAALEWPHQKSPLGVITVSAGMVDYRHGQPGAPTVSVKTLLTVADEQLYKAKAAGRHRVASRKLSNNDPAVD